MPQIIPLVVPIRKVNASFPFEVVFEHLPYSTGVISTENITFDLATFQAEITSIVAEDININMPSIEVVAALDATAVDINMNLDTAIEEVPLTEVAFNLAVLESESVIDATQVSIDFNFEVQAIENINIDMPILDIQAAVTLPVTTGLYAWWDAQDFSSLTIVSGAVSDWADKSGNSRTISQSTPSLRPTYVASSLNGNPGLSFTASQLLSAAAFNIATYTFFVVYVPILTSSSVVPFYNGNGGANGFGMIDRGSGTTYGMLFGGVGFAPSSINHVANAAAIFNATRSSSTALVEQRINGVNGYSATRGQNTPSGTFAIGSSSFAGRFHEVIFYDRVLSLAEIQAVESYLQTRWGL